MRSATWCVCLVGRPAGRLAGRPVGRSGGRSIGRSIGRSVRRSVGRSVGFSVGRPQLLICGGDRGDVVFFDTRQRRVLHTIVGAHAAEVNALALPAAAAGGFLSSGGADDCSSAAGLVWAEHCLVTAGGDGDVRVWSLPGFSRVAAVPRLHAAGRPASSPSSLLADVMGGHGHASGHAGARGVLDLQLTPTALFSAGSDGSVKVLLRSAASASTSAACAASKLLGVGPACWQL
jgi:hypothetical protein